MIRSSFLMVVVLISAGCQVYNSTSNDQLLYSSNDALEGEARTILLNRCGSCHSFHQKTVNDLVASGLLERGDSASSDLILRLRGAYLGGAENMPPSQTLPPSEIDKLRSWIDGLD